MSILVAVVQIGVSGFIDYYAAAEAFDQEEIQTPSATWSPPAAPLTPAQAIVIRQELKQSDPGATTDTQAKALEDYLTSPQQSLFYPDKPARIMRQIGSLGTMRGGPVEVHTPRGTVTISINGHADVVMDKRQQPYRSGGWKTVVDFELAAVGVCAVLSLGLGCLLLRGGICVLRRNPRAVWLHRWYLLVQIPLALVTGAAWLKMMLTPDFWFGPEIAWPLGLSIGGVALLYPMILLIALNRRSIRDYYLANSPAA
jgi:hypothetical protein